MKNSKTINIMVFFKLTLINVKFYLLRNKNIFHSRMIEKEILFIPVFINLAKNNLLLFDENPFIKIGI